jgi:asparagine N-glycosylation enzyme membrane subunit Stt3
MIEMDTVNKPEVSKTLVGFYAGTAVFVATVFGVVLFFIFTEQPPNSLVGIVVLVVVAVVVEGIMLSLLASIYTTKYILSDNELILKAPLLIGGTKRIPLETIESAQRTLIPFGMRLFGASFYGGYYYFPSIGKTFVVMTNFNDGVLIKTKKGNYVITPSRPGDFITDIDRRRVQGKTPT